jgi:hypothetical protein
MYEGHERGYQPCMDSGGMQVRTSHLPRRALQLSAFDWVLLQSSKLTTPSSTSLSHFYLVRLTVFVELWPSFKTTTSITLHRSYTINTWQSSDVGERRPTLREHPQFRRGFVFCRDCFVFRVFSGFRFPLRSGGEVRCLYRYWKH